MTATDPRRTNRLYQESRDRIVDLVTGLDEAGWNATLPACPGWSVRDVVAHMTAVAEDWASGRLPIPPPDDVTAAQVARFRGVDVAEILSTWTDAAARLHELAETTELEPPLGDIVVHEHDIRGALGRPGARDSGAVRQISDELLEMLEPPVPLRVIVEDGQYRLGPADGAEIQLHTSRFDVLRWRTGRRSRAQLAAMHWSRDPTPVLDHLHLFGPAEADLVESEELAMTDAPGRPAVVARGTFEAEMSRLRDREKAHTREGDAIAAARRCLPMVEVNGGLTLIGPDGPLTLLDAFEGRRQLIAYYFMWHPGRPAAEQCEGCTWVTTQVAELSYLHSRDITYAVLCQGPYEESRRYRDFMGWEMPWYSALPSLDALLVGRHVGMMHIVCYLGDGDRVFETYWTTLRGVEVMDYSYALMDLTVYGRQEPWEDSPPGWPQEWQVDGSNTRLNGRPIPRWSRLDAGRSDDLMAGS